MRDRILKIAALVLLIAVPGRAGAESLSPITLVVHGGAGTLHREAFTAERETRFRAELERSLRAGFAILSAGGSSLDAVETAVKILEDSELFNAGKGAVFTTDGRNELDASIMDGATGLAGAVAGVTTIKNPIVAARAVMEKTEHVLLSGPGAEQFAAATGLEIVDPQYFFTELRWQALQREKAAAAAVEADAPGDPYTRDRGTVGALALDRAGHLAAATSTGGTTNKQWGRVGDSPIIGAGTWADDRCAVSGTGTGEHFIRHAVAHEICARARYLDQSVATAAVHVVFEVLDDDVGGVITLDRDGNIAMPFNTEGMYRGYIRGDDSVVIEIF